MSDNSSFSNNDNNRAGEGGGGSGSGSHDDPIIRPLPSEEEIRREVECILGRDSSNEVVHSFCAILMTVASPDSEEQYHLAQTAAHHAFSFTLAFDDAFKKFIGFPPPLHSKSSLNDIAAAYKKLTPQQQTGPPKPTDDEEISDFPN